MAQGQEIETERELDHITHKAQITWSIIDLDLNVNS